MISASIMAANMWKNSLKNVESDNNKILYETFLKFFLQQNGTYCLNKPHNSDTKYIQITSYQLPTSWKMTPSLLLKTNSHLTEILDYSYHNGTHHRYPSFVVYSIQHRECASQLFNSYYFTEAQILSYLNNRTLPWYQYTFIMILLEHSQRWMGHNDLFFTHL